MEILKTTEKIASLQKVFNLIFKSKDPFNEIFTENIYDNLLLRPTDGYQLTEEQFKALQKAIQETQNQDVFISITEYRDMFSSDSEHWKIDSNLDYDGYTNLGIFLENAIYSSDGTWGILISHENHAVIGGNPLFIDTFKKYYPSWQNDILVFENLWVENQKEYGSDISWIKEFKNHLNIF